jgi:hypothetical protein
MKLSVDFLDGLNAVKLREEEVRGVINATIEAYARGESHKLTGILATMQFFNNTPDRAKAIIFRLQALEAMIHNNELKNWIRTDGTRVAPIIVQKALVSATAEHPLSIINDDILFEKESFIRRVLEVAQPENSIKN